MDISTLVFVLGIALAMWALAMLARNEWFYLTRMRWIERGRVGTPAARMAYYDRLNEVSYSVMMRRWWCWSRDLETWRRQGEDS